MNYHERLKYAEEVVTKVDGLLDDLQTQKTQLEEDGVVQSKFYDLLLRVSIAGTEDSEEDLEKIRNDASQLCDEVEDCTVSTRTYLEDVEGLLTELRRWLVEGMLEIDARRRRK